MAAAARFLQPSVCFSSLGLPDTPSSFSSSCQWCIQLVCMHSQPERGEYKNSHGNRGPGVPELGEMFTASCWLQGAGGIWAQAWPAACTEHLSAGPGLGVCNLMGGSGWATGSLPLGVVTSRAWALGLRSPGALLHSMLPLSL